jgi:hypothetical protein
MEIPERIMAFELSAEIVQVGTYRDLGARSQVIDMLRPPLTVTSLPLEQPLTLYTRACCLDRFDRNMRDSAITALSIPAGQWARDIEIDYSTRICSRSFPDR